MAANSVSNVKVDKVQLHNIIKSGQQPSISSDVNDDIKDIKQSLSFICSLWDQINKRDEATQQQIVKLSGEVRILKTKVDERDGAISNLEYRVDELEQKDKQSNIIINGYQLQSFGMLMGHGENVNGDVLGDSNGGVRPYGDSAEAPLSNKLIMKDNFIKFAKEKLEVEVERDDIQNIFPLNNSSRGGRAPGASKTTKVVFSN